MTWQCFLRINFESSACWCVCFTYCSFLRAVSEWLKFTVLNVINNILTLIQVRLCCCWVWRKGWMKIFVTCIWWGCWVNFSEYKCSCQLLLTWKLIWWGHHCAFNRCQLALVTHQSSMVFFGVFLEILYSTWLRETGNSLVSGVRASSCLQWWE